MNQLATFRAFYQKYERYLLPGMLLLGLVVDYITFRAIQLETTILLLSLYLVAAILLITYIVAYQSKAGLKKRPFFTGLHSVSLVVLQFLFGALLSASLLFYWFSSTVSLSWPIIGIVALLIVFNERFRESYQRPVVQLSLLYFVLFSFLSLVIPYYANSISVTAFLAAGVASLVLIILLVFFLSRVFDLVYFSQQRIRFSVVTIFLAMNGLYFLNIIPPVPLALRDAGVYHSVTRAGNTYIVEQEQRSLFSRVFLGESITLTNGDPAYVFTSIFAPADLSTTIQHKWEYFNEQTSTWEEKDTLAFAIFGGRQEGYRGYSFKSGLQEGKWRVDVQTERGQVLGRVTFEVNFTEEELVLEQVTK